ncbi:MAG TPA: hypothetical protein DEA91_18100 [Paenibacillus sp.]|nr:hypothetical protein [Paenibacillus sp.]
MYCNPRFKTKEQAYQTLFQYIEFYYNRKRMHGSLGYLSPFVLLSNLTENCFMTVHFLDRGPWSPKP